MSKLDQDHRGYRSVRNEQPPISGYTRNVVILLQKSIWMLAQYWYMAVMLLATIMLGLGFLAPALMSAGQTDAGRTVYEFLAPHNHQLPQRSYFLFSQAGGVQTYSLEQILRFGGEPDNIEAFIGNPEIGFKMALNHRMVAIFLAIVAGGLWWGLAGGQPRLGPVWFVLLALPLLVDGFSHMVSENSGQGFRESNAWAVSLTGGAFPTTFYQGTTIGSLNWLLRTVTGLLFGLALVWFLFTYLSLRFRQVRAQLEPKLRRIGAIK